MKEIKISLQLNDDDDHCDLLCPLMIGDRCYLGKRDEQITTLKCDNIGLVRSLKCKQLEVV